VEEAIYTDKRVEEVAVIGVDHPKWVEAVTAVVVPRKGETLTEISFDLFIKSDVSLGPQRAMAA
jgi:acyl-CoA synthetase (AMP-forming)/AMP-acid ligase II